MSRPKETNYFSYQYIVAQNLYYEKPSIVTAEQYQQAFSHATCNSVLGEGSVSYLYYEGVAQRIYAHNPNAKIIISLRNPVDRAFSHYLMDKRIGHISATIEEVFTKPDIFTKHYQQYFLLGRYYEQIKRYIDTFSANQVMVIWDHQLRNDHKNTLELICEFLEVASNENLYSGKVHNQYKSPKNSLIAKLYESQSARNAARLLPAKTQSFLKKSLFSSQDKPSLSNDFRARVENYYQKDLEKLSLLLSDKHPLTWIHSQCE
ncbi:uncharacterized protein YozE (UPF0346 family) [Litorivivens lipolytica]|uniref:Uncharacterized protein YozE (UPF0346 family) n=2 Tax=Litorivivens lipolytica TaxID=1524264 RepID=A0A7W4W7N1_9GAMM|nr:uncharacterized protein YozE (UPF0346 family) [Litorivivens lipolytica]